MNRLALGTAQFGLSYGVSNTRGQTCVDEVKCILSMAHSAGLDTIDTAIAYGNSEHILGTVGVNGWHLVSKLPPLSSEINDIENWVLNHIKGSLNRLRQKKIYALLLHRTADLLSAKGTALLFTLKKLKEKDLVSKIGLSVYSLEELDAVRKVFSPDLIQIPFNPIDQRFLQAGLLKELKENGILIHVRSIFLQGFLLMAPNVRPYYFNRWQFLWNIWDEWLKDNHISPLSACVRFALSHIEIDRIIVGVESVTQLQEILATTSGELPTFPIDFKSIDPELINPSLWKIA